MKATILQHLQAKVSPEEIRAIYTPKRRWNRHKAYDSLLTVLGMVAVGAFLAWMIVGWIDGTFY